MTTTLNDCLNTIITAIDEDVAIREWCIAKYGRAPKIYLGVDPAKPPETKDKTPMICIATHNRCREQFAPYINYGISIGIILENKATVQTGNVIKYQGILDINELAEMVNNAYTEKLCKNCFQAIETADIDDTNGYPYWLVGWKIQVRCKITPST